MVAVAVQGGKGFRRRPGPRLGAVVVAVDRLFWRARAGLFISGEGPSASSRAAAVTADLLAACEREQTLAQVRVHALVAVQIGELAQGYVAKRADLRQQLMERENADDLSATWLRSRIEEVDRLISQQVGAVDWHLREGHRLRQRIADSGFSDAGPAARGGNGAFRAAITA